LGDVSAAEQQRIANVLNNLNLSELSERYDCIIHTESLEEDAWVCVEKYCGEVKDDAHRESCFARAQSKKSERKHHVNPSPHAACKEYFDAETENIVWQSEGPLAETLGYNTCCAR